MSESKSKSAAAPAKSGSPSPLPGCLILITVIVVFGILVTVFTYVFQKQNRLIDDFTVAEAAEVPRMEPTAEQISAVDKKTTALLDAALAEEMIRVLFTTDDLNTLIATRELLADFRGQTYVHSVSEDGIAAEMSQTMRSGFLRQGVRFLNGTFRVKPKLGGKTVLFEVVDIDVPGMEVPEGFIESYPSFMKIDPKLAPFDKVLPKLGRVYLEGDKVVVETRAAPTP